MNLADAFIQSDIQCTQAIHFFSMCVPWELNPQPFAAANAMLYHWATGTLISLKENSNNKSDPTLYEVALCTYI